MKAYEILTAAFGMAGESLEDFPDKRLPLIWLNVAAAEAGKAENHIRERHGRPVVAVYRLIGDLYDEVDMDSEICTVCLPLALTAFLYSDRGEDNLSARYRERFVQALQNAAMGREKGIEDCYGGGV